MFMADCGVIPDPNVEQLADIAVSTAQLARQLIGTPPRVALLSYSTKGSATHSSIGKVQAATALARQKAEQRLLEAQSMTGERMEKLQSRLEKEIAGTQHNLHKELGELATGLAAVQLEVHQQMDASARTSSLPPQ